VDATRTCLRFGSTEFLLHHRVLACSILHGSSPIAEEQRRHSTVAAAIAHQSLNAWMLDILDRENAQGACAATAAA
jgi:hypothetical protein